MRGNRLGRYLILRLLGRGGMGAVYACYDPDLGRRLAVKVLQRTAVSVGDMSRLLSEARTMAKVAHPNVVRVFDVGEDAGRIFIAMELVEGETMREWMRRERRSWRAVVAVMAQVARGLISAHEQGIVHRDVKPANILLGRDGTARVSDFGVARAEVERTDRPHAEPDDKAGTPAYMAPEQLDGRADPRADQYSFCVALYEALHGQRPPAQRENARVPEHLRKLLARGLSERADDRYPSMAELLVDLQRDPARRRRRILAGAAAVCLIVGSGAAAVALRGGAETACAEDRARLRGAWDDSVASQLQASFQRSSRPHAGATAARTTALLEQRAADWLRSRREACEATRVRGSQSERILDLRMACLDRKLDELRSLTDVFVHSDDVVVDRAIEAVFGLSDLAGCADIEALTAAVPPPRDEAEKRRVLALQARLDVIQAQRAAGKFSEALESATALEEEARASSYLPIRAKALISLADLQQESGNSADAVRSAERAMAAAAAAGDDSTLSRAANQLLFELAEGTRRPRQALAIAKLVEAGAGLAGLAPAARRGILDSTGHAYSQLGDYDEAQRLYLRSQELRAQVLPANHPENIKSLNNLGLLAETRREDEEAIAYLTKALAMAEEVFGKDHPDVANALNSLAMAEQTRGHLARAIELYQRASALWESTLGSGHPSLGNVYNNMAIVSISMGDFKGALQGFQRAADVWERVYGRNDLRTAMAINNLAQIRGLSGDLDAAQTALEEVLAIRRQLLGEDHHLVGRTHHNIGEVLRLRGQCDRATPHFSRALAIFETNLAPDHPDRASPLAALGLCALERGADTAALPLLERAHALYSRRAGDPLEMAVTDFGLARALWSNGARSRSIQLARRALAAHNDNPNPYPIMAAERRAVEVWLRTHAAPRK